MRKILNYDVCDDYDVQDEIHNSMNYKIMHIPSIKKITVQTNALKALEGLLG